VTAATLPARPGAPLLLRGDTLAQALRPERRVDTARVSPRQVRLLELLADGLSSAAIGVELGESAYAVDSELRRLYRLLEVHSRREAVAVARACGLLPSGGDR